MTKWRIKRLPDVEGKISFSWDLVNPVQCGVHWDWNIIEKETETMEVNEEKIIEIL